MKQRIGRYAIEAELGHGAFGVVYRAFDPNVNRQVAIKVLIATDNPEVLSKFRAEAGTTGSLVHKNIITVYEFAEEAGTPYLVMELLEGQTLQEIIRAGASPAVLENGVLEKVEIMYQVAEGLQHAHAKGVVHRDMKPANIMVTPRGLAKIMDFGIARLLDHDTTSWKTRQGDFAGTIPYMAPEQFRGEDADKLVDIFSYGVIYYELLSGEQPFQARDAGAVMYRISSYDPPPLRERFSEIPEALDNMVQHLISKERDLRVEKMEDVLFETQPILQQLRQSRAAGLAAEIRPVIAAGDPQTALAQVKRILDLDPFHAEARQWREQIQSKVRTETLRARAQGLIEEGDACMAGRRFAEAIASYEGALSLNKTRTDLPVRVEKAKSALKSSRDSARLVADARWEMVQKHFDQALEKASQAALIDPANSEAALLRDDLARQIREQRTAAAVARVEDLAARAEYDAALAVLAGLDPEIAREPVFTALRIRIEAARDESARRRRAIEFQLALAAARNLLAAGGLAESERAALDLCKQFGEEPAALEFLYEIRERQAAQRRVEAISAITQSARALIEEKRFEEAIAALGEGLRSYPSDVTMQRLVEMAKALAAAQQRAAAIASVLNDAAHLREQAEIDQALRLIDGALVEFGDAPELEDCKRELEIDREQRDYAIGRDRVVVEAVMLSASGQIGAAIGFLEDALARYPNDPELLRALDDAREAERVFQRAKARKETLARIAALENAGKLTEALAEAERSLHEHRDEGKRDSTLSAIVDRIRGKLRDQERERALATHVARIDAAMTGEDWDAATAQLSQARLEFPGAPALARYSTAAIEAGRRRTALARLENGVNTSFARSDLKTAAELLAAARQSLSADAAWKKLWQELDRRLRIGDRLVDAVLWLEALLSRYPADELIAGLLASAREAGPLQRERDALIKAVAQVEELESRGAPAEALRAAESALRDHPGHAGLEVSAERLREKLKQRERDDALADRVRRIELAIAEADWKQASAEQVLALAEFPDARVLADLRKSIEAGRRGAQMKALSAVVRESLPRGDFENAIRELSAARSALSSEPEWSVLWREVTNQLVGKGQPSPPTLARIESLASRYPDQPELARMAASTQLAATERREKTVRDTLAKVDSLQASGKLERCLPEIEAALKVEPADERLLTLAQRIRDQLRAQEQRRELGAVTSRIEAAIKAEEWENASALLNAAQSEFPGDPALLPFPAAIETGRRRGDIRALEAKAKDSFARGDLDAVVQQLAATRAALSQEPAWQAIWRQLEQRKSYEAGLSLAEKAFAIKEFGRAQDILQWLLPEAPDGRARALLTLVTNEGRKQRAAAVDTGVRERLIAKAREDAKAKIREQGPDAFPSTRLTKPAEPPPDEKVDRVEKSEGPPAPPGPDEPDPWSKIRRWWRKP